MMDSLPLREVQLFMGSEHAHDGAHRNGNTQPRCGGLCEVIRDEEGNAKRRTICGKLQRQNNGIDERVGLIREAQGFRVHIGAETGVSCVRVWIGTRHAGRVIGKSRT